MMVHGTCTVSIGGVPFAPIDPAALDRQPPRVPKRNRQVRRWSTTVQVESDDWAPLERMIAKFRQVYAARAKRRREARVRRELKGKRKAARKARKKGRRS